MGPDQVQDDLSGGWFQVKTPLGTYNPDWAAKIECGKAHFDSLADGTDSPAQFKLAKVLEDLLTGG